MDLKEYVENSPKLLNEWDYVKNEESGLYPDKITLHSHKKVHWKCSKGHKWIATVASRSAGNGCPFCSGREVVVGQNDLLSCRPEIAKEWNYERNGELQPFQVTKSANKRVWWRCSVCSHEWQDTVNHRYNGRNCPNCMKERHTSFPEQAILFYCKKMTDAIGQYKYDNKYEIDIYLPKFKIGIEYDGMAFHNTEKSRENEQKKNEYLLKAGIRLIRVKETSLLQKSQSFDTLFYIPDNQYKNLNDIILRIIRIIDDEQKNNFTIDINRDKTKILEAYIVSKKRAQSSKRIS